MQNSIDLLIIDLHPTWYIKVIIPNLGFLWATDNLPTNTKLICCMLSIQTNWSTLNSTKWRVIMSIGVIHTTPAKTFKALSGGLGKWTMGCNQIWRLLKNSFKNEVRDHPPLKKKFQDIFLVLSKILSKRNLSKNH